MSSTTFSAGASGELPADLRTVSILIDSGRLPEARERLEGIAEASELLELMRLKLAVAEQRLEPSSALSAVMAFLRKEPRHPAALGLYQEFSLKQYQAGKSSLAHSHPPPPERAR